MKNLLVIYEGPDWRRFGSLALLRPVFSLRSGMTTLWQALKRGFRDYDLAFICRPALSHVALRETGTEPNRITSSEMSRVVFLDASVCVTRESLEELQQANTSGFISAEGRVLAVSLVGASAEQVERITAALIKATVDDTGLIETMEDVGLKPLNAELPRYSYVWDLMLNNRANIGRDYEIAMEELGALREQNQAPRLEGASIIGEGAVYVHPAATVLPGVVFDTAEGPIYLDEDTFVEPGTYIVGPFYAAPGCKLLGGKLAGSSLGPVCQIAGELEESVLQGYINKHHAGFIGHSYIGEWVNFGAMTTNSDLKNNYSNVRVDIAGELIDSGSNKVGSFIGDHTKFGIGTLLNTGINIGIFCNIFGGMLVAEKNVPSFSWGGSGSWQWHDIDKALQTAQRAMQRRGRELSKNDVDLIRSLAGE